MAEKNPLKILIGPARLSYAHLLEPTSFGDEGGEKKYSVAFVWPKTDKKLTKAVQDAIDMAIKSKWEKTVPKKLDSPLRDGDVEKPGDPVYAGCWYVNAKSSNRPYIVDKAQRPLTDKEEIYSGMFGIGSVSFFAYDKKGVGVGAALNGVMKTKNGDPLSSQSTPEEDFADIDPALLDGEDDNDPTDLDDLG